MPITKGVKQLCDEAMAEIENMPAADAVQAQHDEVFSS